MPDDTADEHRPRTVRTRITARSSAVWWVVGAVVLLLIGITVVVLSLNDKPEAVDADGHPLPTDPVEFVEHYLTALAHDEADNALTYLAASHDDTVNLSNKPQLSEKVLAASNYIAPLHDIHVDDARPTGTDAYDVPASFSIGNQIVHRTFQVRTDDHVAIRNGLVVANPTGFDTSGLRFNGQSTSTTVVRLFPGAYVIEPEYSSFRFVGDAGPVLLVDRSATAKIDALRPEITDAAKQHFRRLVSASLDACLASPDPDTECGLTVSAIAGRPAATAGTVHRAPSEALRAALRAQIADPSQMTTMDEYPIDDLPQYLQIRFSDDAVADLTATVTPPDGPPYEVSVSRLRRATIDFSTILPRVTWR